MNSRRYIALIVCLFMLSFAKAQTVGKPMLSLVGEGDSLFHLRFEAQDCQPQVDTHSVRGYSRIEWAGMAFGTGRVGCPDMPALHALVRLPKGSTLEVKDVDAVSTMWMRAVPYGKPLAPVTEGWVKDGPRPEYLPDEKVYGTWDSYRGGERVEVENLGAMGTEQLFRVTVRPMYYQPVGGNLVYDGYIDAKLLASKSAPRHLTNGYLIVSRPQFREGLQPFVRWKRQEGYEVTELYADTNRRDSVKALIDEAFGAGFTTSWPCYILIVGDAAQIQAYTGTTRPAGLGTHPTDLYYADHTGDNLPDAILGRWPVNDTAELRAVVEKTLRYERGLDLDTAALHRTLLVAGKESQDPAPITTNGQVNYLKREIKRNEPAIDTLCYYNPASTSQGGQILSEIRNGVGLLSYTAHCTTSGWSNPAVTFNSIDTLSMHRPTVFVNNCCQSNNFTGTCFGEQLLRKPQSGGVAVIGATNSTLWNEDFYWAVGPKYPFSLNPQYDSLRPGAFDPWLGGEINTMGQMLMAGNLAVTAFGSPYSRFYWEIYCLFGDPALVPWLGTPQRVQLVVADTVAVGTMELHVSGTSGAIVSAMQGDEQLGVVILDEHQSALLQLRRPTDTMPVTFTATKPRMLPREIIVPSSMPQGKAAAFTDAVLADTAADFIVVNFGVDTLFGLNVTLYAADSGAMYASFTASAVMIDTMEPHAMRPLHLPLHIDRWAPLLDAYITATDAYGDSWHLKMSTSLEGASPELAFTLAGADSVATNVLYRGGDYLVGVTATGVCDTLHVATTVLPEGSVVEGGEGWLPVSIGYDATHLRLEGFVGRGNYSRSYEYYLNIGDNCDGFSNGLRAYPWQAGGTQPWTVDSTVSHSGRYSLRSGAIDYRQTSTLTLDVMLPSTDSISFWLRTSTELDYDKVSFTIDGLKFLDISGEKNWRRYAFRLSAGSHSLCWRYVKDESTSSGSDCVWLDDVRLPMALWDAPYGALDNDDMMGITTVEKSDCRLHMFPNPSDGKLTIDTDNGKAEYIRVCDLYGRTVYLADLCSAVMPVALNLPLPDGIYFVELHTDGGTAYSKLIIIHP